MRDTVANHEISVEMRNRQRHVTQEPAPRQRTREYLTAEESISLEPRRKTDVPHTGSGILRVLLIAVRHGLRRLQLCMIKPRHQTFQDQEMSQWTGLKRLRLWTARDLQWRERPGRERVV